MSEYFPAWVAHKKVPRRSESAKGKSVDHVVCQNKATLVYLAGQAVVTIHTWLSTTRSIRKPDRLVFDLDPPGDDFEVVRFAARKTRELLNELGLSCFLMTTGSRGLHVVVPLKTDGYFERARMIGRKMAEIIASRYPDKLTTEFFKRKRRGRLFMDYTRNAYGVTTVAPYSVRLRTGAPVATPLDWDELDDGSLNSRSYSVKNIFRRVSRKDDPWRDAKDKRKAVSLSVIEQELVRHKKENLL